MQTSFGFDEASLTLRFVSDIAIFVLKRDLKLQLTALVNCNANYVLVKVKPSLRQAFSKVINAMNLCFIHALLYNTPNK